MSYIDDNLVPGEDVIYEGKLSFWAIAKWAVPGFLMVPFLFANALWGTFVFVLGVLMMCVALIIYATTEMAVTTQRVIAKRGWIARKTTEISLGRVEGVEINQTIFERMFNFGDILVSGVGSHKARIDDVSDPMSFRKALLTSLGQFEATGQTSIEKGRLGVEEKSTEGSADQEKARDGAVKLWSQGRAPVAANTEKASAGSVEADSAASRMHSGLLQHLETDSKGRVRAKSEELLVQFVLQHHERHPELGRILEIDEGELSRLLEATGLAEQIQVRR